MQLAWMQEANVVGFDVDTVWWTFENSYLLFAHRANFSRLCVVSIEVVTLNDSTAMN